MKTLLRLLRATLRHPLNRGARVAALLRVLRWQVVSRLAPGPVALPFVNDTLLLARPGMTAATGNYYFGLMEPAEMGFVLHLLRADDLFVDVGANIGSYTVLAAGVAGARVIAIEPIASTFRALTRNARLNADPDRVEVHNIGVADRPGLLRFTCGADAMNHVARPDERGETTEVPVSTLDAVVGDRAPTVLKIDVEGFEGQVLQGARRVLESPALCAVILEANGLNAHYGQSNETLGELMAGLGFTPHGYDPRTRALGPPPAGAANVIFVRDRARVMERVRAGPTVRLVTGRL
ncbi:FkbM family methyltransferase [Roseospira navarrensis]|uniref:FkbM family methyltransferase n=1 Tax=Roseospira navarrensis TaxID=140058 RepID=A0A7X2D4B7_9PROT|nr:FkbM family methyltransferase [Roseospira navarrensis]MQX37763.1 FkbM family methyltransferase [Roseospira navarrensis]